MESGADMFRKYKAVILFSEERYEAFYVSIKLVYVYIHLCSDFEVLRFRLSVMHETISQQPQASQIESWRE